MAGRTKTHTHTQKNPAFVKEIRKDLKDLDKALLRHVAQVSIGASALRNQGASVIGPTRCYLMKEIHLDKLSVALQSKEAFEAFLNKHTSALKQKFEVENGEGWGAARKALNLFLRDVCYNTSLVHALGLPKSGPSWTKSLHWLEIPLDGQVAKELRTYDRALGRWHSLKTLDSIASGLYQASAMSLAKELGTARVHLDLALWRREAKGR